MITQQQAPKSQKDKYLILIESNLHLHLNVGDQTVAAMPLTLNETVEKPAAAGTVSETPNVEAIEKDNDSQSSATIACEPKAVEEEKIPYNKDYRFWLIMLTLCFSVTLASLESTVVITSLPTIVEKLEMGKNYIWVANAYFLSR